jgi:CRISPR-associated protein Cmr5
MAEQAIASKPTLEQRRAKHAWDEVDAIVKKYVRMDAGKKKVLEEGKKFGGQAKKLPIRIMASGLGQALAFLKAKGYAPELLKAIGDWVLDKRSQPRSTKPRPNDDELLLRIIKGDSNSLRLWTDETLAYLQWLNRFCEAQGLTEGD